MEEVGRKFKETVCGPSSKFTSYWIHTWGISLRSVANLLSTRTNKFQKKLKEEKNEKRREKKKTESWIKIALHPEFSRTPYDIVAEMSQKENELRRENNDLQDAQAKQAEQLCEALKEVHAERHTGRNFSDVCHKQQQRHLSHSQ